MPVETERFSHLVMSVADLQRSLAFYRDLLGLDVVFEMEPEDFPEGGPALHAVGCRAGDVVLELTCDPRWEGPVATDGSPVMAFSVSDIRETERRLLDAGVQPVMPLTEMLPGLFMIFVADPDGRTVEFVQFPEGARSSLEYNQARGD